MHASTVWKTHRNSGDTDARDHRLAEHLPLVYHVARRLQRTVARDTELDDLVSAGTIGLMHAVDGFDPSRGLAFSTFAAPRIEGAILDELRRWDHAPRSLRRKQRQITRATDVLSRRLGQGPTESELAEELGITLETLWSWKATAEEAVRVSLDQPAGDHDSRSSAPLYLMADAHADDIEQRICGRQEIELLQEEIGKLKEQQRIVISLYFFQELKLHQIADVLGLTESRISQVRTQALNALRARTQHLRGR